MLYNLVRDAAHTLFFRYQPAEAYRYSAPAVFVVLLIIGLQLAASTPAFGHSPPVIALFLIIAVLKWLILSRVMSSMLHYYGSPRLPLHGYILATEALSIPLLLALYVPSLIPLALFWQVWIFLAQARGLMQMGNLGALRLLLCYFTYFIILLLCSMAVTMLFHQAGWIDMQALQQSLLQELQQK